MGFHFPHLQFLWQFFSSSNQQWQGGQMADYYSVIFISHSSTVVCMEIPVQIESKSTAQIPIKKEKIRQFITYLTSYFGKHTRIMKFMTITMTSDEANDQNDNDNCHS